MGSNTSNAPSRNRRLAIVLAVIAIAMFGFGYLLVPMYNVFCNAFGINGKTKNVAAAMAKQMDKSRTVEVQFLANVNKNLPWTFYPMTHSVEVHPGENKRVSFYVKNKTDHDMTIRAVPSVSPGDAARHFKKTECFCFSYQTLPAQTGRVMPLLFHLDLRLPTYIKTVTLGYTLFDETNR